MLLGCQVQDVSFGEDLHEVSFTQMDTDVSTNARWLVDAAGRASLLKRKLGLAKDVGHTINSAWFRLAGGLDIEDFGRDNEEWMGRMSEPGIRQYSTNHLLGKGYWVWLIPLSSGPISIGVCADPRVHPFEEISKLDRMGRLAEATRTPLGNAVEPRLGDVEDFLRVRDFAYGVERVYSPDRWSLVGEAGAFADPFYSPGSDFIGSGNIFTSDLICRISTARTSPSDSSTTTTCTSASSTTSSRSTRTSTRCSATSGSRPTRCTWTRSSTTRASRCSR